MQQFVTVDEAAKSVKSGMTLALGGMTLYRRPVGFVKALLRQPKPPDDLTLLSFTAGFESDLLVGAGCISRVRTVYFGLESFGFAPCFTERANAGDITIIEESEASLVLGIRAALSGVDYLPSRAWAHTDMLHLRPDVRTVRAAYSDETYTAFPAIQPDVAVIHGIYADEQGNVAINKNLAIDPELIFVSNLTIATVERIIPQLEPSPHLYIIPYPGIDLIAELPGGAAPTSCHPLYPVHGNTLLDYVTACGRGEFDAFLSMFM